MGPLWAAFALALSIAICSCAQDVKITAPRYALVYGVADYQTDKLYYTVDDARSMASTLTTYGCSAANIHEKEDNAVTKAQIRSDILSLASVSSDSTVLFYYSGHGSYVDSTWGPPYYPAHSGPYIVPYDAVGADGIDITTVVNLISPSELASWFSQVGTKNVIIILDSCFSGGFVSPGSAIDASPQDYSSMPYFSAFSTALSNFGSLLVANASASGAKTPIVFSAAGTNESSYDGTVAMQHGVFTYYLLQAATDGDSNGDGVVTTTEAYVYTSVAIKSQWDANPYVIAFLPHISGGTRDLVLFVK
ncbi:MAG: caspase family protein [Rectinemataceae bacterium]|jgi:uncharacterized caspase-like protein